jgi:DNA modification methylase
MKVRRLTPNCRRISSSKAQNSPPHRWDNERIGNGYRSRRCGDYLPVLQRPPKRAKVTWCDHSIPNRWPEKVDRKLHAHIKPIGLIRKLIDAVTRPGDLVVDPAAGSFVVMHAAHQLGRDFVGCDLAYDTNQSHLHGEMNEYLSRHPRAVRGARQLWP